MIHFLDNTTHMGRNFNEETVREEKLSPRMEKWLVELFEALQYSDLEKITLSEMIDKVPISRSTIYRYFKTKEEIILAMVKLRLNTLSEKLFDISVDDYSTTMTAFLGFIEFWQEVLLNESLYFIQQISSYNENVRDILSHFKEALLVELRKLYQIGMNDGTFKKVSLNFLLKWDALFIDHLYGYSYDQSKEIEKMVKNYVELKLTGLAKK